MSTSMEPVVIRLRLSAVRYGVVAVIVGALGTFAAFRAFQPDPGSKPGDLIAEKIGRMLMSVDRIAGVFPIPAVAALFLLGFALFLIWALASRRPFALTMDSRGVTWPSLAPWRWPFSFSWSEIDSVARNQAGDHLVFQTTMGRKVMPAWWLPSGTSVEEVARTATAIRTQAVDHTQRQ